MKNPRKRMATVYLSLLALYALLFIAGLLNFSHDTVIFHTGLPSPVENGMVMGLSLLSIVKVLYELTRL